MSDNVQRQMASGAIWMVLFKLVERSLGLVSTLILARLLSPDDFGVVAMATSFIVMAELLSAFGFDVAIIQNRAATPADYNTAWTCNLLLGATITMLMLAMAAPIAEFYRKPELMWVVFALAFGSLATGAENIGVVAFRKELDFRKEFKFQVSRKFIGFIVVIPLAFWFRSYWALVAGILFSKVAGTTISYLMHPYRPRLTLSRVRALFVFSRWLLLNNLVSFLKERSSDFFLGRFVGARGLGTYNVAYELANLPTTEISAPINRALLPGFAKIDDTAKLESAYANALSVLALLALPAAATLFAVAPFVVAVLLGQKWLDAIPLMQILAFNGALLLFHSSISSVLFARGFPGRVTFTNGCFAALLIGLLTVTFNVWPQVGVTGAAIVALTTSAVCTPLYLYQMRRCLGVSPMLFLIAVARPVLASSAAVFAVGWLLPAYVPAMPAAAAVACLLGGSALSVAVYAAVLWLLWHLAGRPQGTGEHMVITNVREQWARRYGPKAGPTGG